MDYTRCSYSVEAWLMLEYPTCYSVLHSQLEVWTDAGLSSVVVTVEVVLTTMFVTLSLSLSLHCCLQRNPITKVRWAGRLLPWATSESESEWKQPAELSRFGGAPVYSVAQFVGRSRMSRAEWMEVGEFKTNDYISRPF